MTERPSEKKNPLGPTGSRVIANVKQLRQSKGLSYKELSERLARHGRPIPVLGLSRMERGERRVDTDDLVALALALNTTPNRLLMPEVDIAAVNASYMVTPGIPNTARQLWAWATGEVPLGHKPASVADDPDTRGAQVVFNRENQPHHWAAGAEWGFPGLADADTGRRLGAAMTVLSAVVLQAFQAGLTTAQIRTGVTAAITAALVHPGLDAADIRITESESEFRVEICEPSAGEGRDAGEFVIDLRVPKSQAGKNGDGGDGQDTGERPQ